MLIIMIPSLDYGKYVFADSAISYYNPSPSLVKTKFGTVKITGSMYGNQVYINSTKIDIAQKDKLYVFGIQNKISENNTVTFIIWGGGGGTMDGDTNIHCKFLVLFKNQRYKISNLTYCPKDKTISLTNGVIKYNFINPLPYSLESDVGELNFNGNKVNIIKPVHNKDFYKSYYATYTPYQIYKQVLDFYGSNDVVSELNNFGWCHACGGFGAKYCEPFNWIQNPAHDKYYYILKPICSKPVYEYVLPL